MPSIAWSLETISSILTTLTAYFSPQTSSLPQYCSRDRDTVMLAWVEERNPLLWTFSAYRASRGRSFPNPFRTEVGSLTNTR